MKNRFTDIIKIYRWYSTSYEITCKDNILTDFILKKSYPDYRLITVQNLFLKYITAFSITINKKLLTFNLIT